MNRDWSTNIPVEWQTISLKGGSSGEYTEYYTVNIINQNRLCVKTRCSDIAVGNLKSPYMSNTLREPPEYIYCILTYSGGGRMSRKKFENISFLMYSFLNHVDRIEDVYMQQSINKSRILLVLKKGLFHRQMYIILKALRMFWFYDGNDWMDAVKTFAKSSEKDTHWLKRQQIDGEDLIFNMLQYSSITSESPTKFLEVLDHQPTKKTRK